MKDVVGRVDTVKQQELLNRAERKELAKKRLFKLETGRCPCCKKGQMVTIEVKRAARAPPSEMNSQAHLTSLLQQF